MLFGGETITAPGNEDAEDQVKENVDEVNDLSEDSLEEGQGAEGTLETDDDQQNADDNVSYNPAELAKAYQSQKLQSQQSNQPPAGQSVQLDPDELNETFFTQFQNNPLGTMQYLIDSVVTNKTAPFHEREQQQQLASNMDPIAKEFAQVRTEQGMTQLFAKVGEIAQELGNPKLAQNPSARVLRMAAQELFGDSKAELFKKGKQQGAQEAAESRRQKQAVNMSTQSKKPPQEAPKTAEREIADGIIAASQKRNLFGR